ncbi:MAG: phenylalanine--tRNA ligase subunit alpha [Candidatus Absconditicoccaceae bacterium]
MLETDKILKELDLVKDIIHLELFFDKYLGKKGLLNEEFKKITTLSIEEKKTYGKTLSDAKTILTDAYESKEQLLSMDNINAKLREDIVDISLEGKKIEQGSFNLITRVRRDLEEAAKTMGFIVESGNEVATKFQNFESVNIPLTHPATEMHDTIYLNEKDKSGEYLVLRTHTSALQNYMIKKYGLPLKVIVPGRCYRFDEMDATHDTMFFQFEGMYIDKGVSIANFKDVIQKFLSVMLKRKVEVRMRPGFFPFVEPGFEIDARYELVDRKTGEKAMSKWIELLGAGMVHPNVLKIAGVDPEEYSGFAFGPGINRLAAMRYGIKDIRYFTNGDLRFAKSFK